MKHLGDDIRLLDESMEDAVDELLAGAGMPTETGARSASEADDTDDASGGSSPRDAGEAERCV